MTELNNKVKYLAHSCSSDVDFLPSSMTSIAPAAAWGFHVVIFIEAARPPCWAYPESLNFNFREVLTQIRNWLFWFQRT